MDWTLLIRALVHLGMPTRFLDKYAQTAKAMGILHPEDGEVEAVRCRVATDRIPELDVRVRKTMTAMDGPNRVDVKVLNQLPAKMVTKVLGSKKLKWSVPQGPKSYRHKIPIEVVEVIPSGWLNFGKVADMLGVTPGAVRHRAVVRFQQGVVQIRYFVQPGGLPRPYIEASGVMKLGSSFPVPE
jgi:hypothetical protein